MRIIWRGLTGLSALCVVICVAMSCVGGGIESTGEPSVPPREYESTGRMPALLESPSPLVPPQGVAPELWQQLNSELEKQLSAVRVTSTPPLRPLSQTVLSENGIDLLWGYYSNGDYDQNGEVNTADLAPIAIHFKESAYPFKFPPNSVQAVIDGDDNGEINIADVTPIAVNFQNTVAKYNVYRSQNIADYPTEPSGDNGDAELLASINLADAAGEPNATRLQFDRALPETLTEEYIWVRPEDNFEVEGIASNRIGPLSTMFTLDGHVFMAGGGSDPLPGVPVALSGDATAQTVTDINGHYSFEGLLSGDYTVTPSGDPYGYAPEFIATTIAGTDKYLSPIYPAPVDIIRRWVVEEEVITSAHSLSLDDENNIYLTGSTEWEFEEVVYVLKYDMFGNLLWSSIQQFGLESSPKFLQLDSVGNIYLAGDFVTAEDALPNRRYMDIFLLKLDNSGNREWLFTYSSPTPDSIIDIQFHDDTFGGMAFDLQGNLKLGCQAGGLEESPAYYLTVNPEGELIDETYIELETDEYEWIDIDVCQADPQGNIYSGGGLMGLLGESVALLVKMDPAGEILWLNEWSYEDPGMISEQTHEIQFGQDGATYAATVITRSDPGLSSFSHLAKLTTAGHVSWEIQLSTSASLGETDLTIGPMGKLWLYQREFVRGDGFMYHWYPMIVSFQHDGDLRFARRWFVESERNVTHVNDVKVNSYGVVMLCGSVDHQNGVWETAEVTLDYLDSEQLTQSLKPYSAEGIVDSPPAALIDVVGQEHDEGQGRKSLLMYYRP